MQAGKHQLPLAQHRGALIRSVTAVIDDTCSSSTSNPCSPSRRLTIDTGKRKPSPAERTETLCNEILACLRSEEWRAMRSTNLGVLSGTGVIEDLLMRRLQTQVAALHVLVLKHTSAGNQLSALGTSLTQREMQQMQVLMDACGFPELSDYLRVLRYNTMDPSATSEVGAPINWGARRAKSVPRNRMSHSQEVRPRSLRHRAYDADTLRFADVVGPQHRLVSHSLTGPSTAMTCSIRS